MTDCPESPYTSKGHLYLCEKSPGHAGLHAAFLSTAGYETVYWIDSETWATESVDVESVMWDD